MKSIMKKSASSSKKSMALKILKKSRRMKKSKQVQVGATSGFVPKGARMRVIPPQEEFKFRFSLPLSDDEDDVELDEYDYMNPKSPIVVEDENVELHESDDDVELDEDDYMDLKSPVIVEDEDVELHESDDDEFPVAGVEDDEEAQLAWEESLLPHKEDKYSMLDDYAYDNYLFHC